MSINHSFHDIILQIAALGEEILVKNFLICDNKKSLHEEGGGNVYGLVVLFSYLEEALRMSAYRTYLRSFLADYEMTAVAAFPHYFFALLEYLLHFDVV